MALKKFHIEANGFKIILEHLAQFLWGRKWQLNVEDFDKCKGGQQPRSKVSWTVGFLLFIGLFCTYNYYKKYIMVNE